jgi:DNA-binding transcriptional LysR family regulator
MYMTKAGEIWYERVFRAIKILDNGALSVLSKSSHLHHHINQITTTQLRALIAVTKYQNFSLAGRNLGISQSSLHRAAKELEQQIEVILFEKSNVGITPTKAAKTLAQAARLTFSEIRQAYHEVLALQDIDTSELLIGSMPLPRTVLLPKVINAFSTKKPSVGINIIDGTYDDLLQHLRHGDIDFLTGALRIPSVSDDIEQIPLFSTPLSFVARYDHPIFTESVESLEQLKKYPWIVPKEGTPTRAAFNRLFDVEQLQDAQRIVESNSQILIREVLLGSDRLSIISAHQIQHELNFKLLRTVPYMLPHTSRPIGVAVRKSFVPTATQSQFLTLLKAISSQFN